MVGDANGGADGLPLLTANLTAMAATGGDDGDGSATMPKLTGGGGNPNARGGGFTVHKRTREMGQTEEENTGKVYMSSDRRDQAANGWNRIGKTSDSVS